MRKQKITNTLKDLWRDESAQGATEYILLLVAVVAIVAIFRRQITEAMSGILDTLRGKLGEATGG